MSTIAMCFIEVVGGGAIKIPGPYGLHYQLSSFALIRAFLEEIYYLLNDKLIIVVWSWC